MSKDLEVSQRLSNQDYRDFYQRPYYQWPRCNDKQLEQHKQEYTKELDRLSHLTQEDCNIWPEEFFMDIINHRKYILSELLKDI